MIFSLLSACASNPPIGEGSPTNQGSDLPTPVAYVTETPNFGILVDNFISTLVAEDFPTLYLMVDGQTKAGISEADFTALYQDSFNALTLKNLSIETLSVDETTEGVKVNGRWTYQTNLFGDFTREVRFDLILEGGGWKVVWNDGLVFPDMAGGNRLALDNSSPDRGFILDRSGSHLVTQADIVAIGLIPSQINEKTEGVLLATLGDLVGKYPGQIQSLYNDQRDAYWYIPVGEAPLSEVNKQYNLLTSLGGVVMTNYSSRYYYENGIAPQLIGYVAPISPDQLTSALRDGYKRDAVIGQSGVESWGETILAGTPGGTLYLVDNTGKIISNLGESASIPSANIALTLDENLQIGAQKALTGFKGSIVVLERDTGRILAMVSSPTYDPNVFDSANANNPDGLGLILNDFDSPLLDRSAHGEYALGSVFKIITYSAALESQTYTPETKYFCGYEFTEYPEKTLYDWTWEHYQNELIETGEGTTRPSGELDLNGALMRSCNPYFYHIGLDLYNQGRVNTVANMARGFGLGSVTGLDVVAESAGTIVDPPTQLDAINQAIGQGDVLVTPLQVADFIAAIGNGGTLYKPQAIEKIVYEDGTEEQVFEPVVRGVLPITADTLASLRTSMESVIRNPRGTAYIRFTNISVPIYGKTGTAETSQGIPHSWFAGYTDANNPDLPDIAIAVVGENAGEGSEIAAPIFKRIVELYFNGRALSPYWWETHIGITRTPTPLVTETPTPEENN